MPMLKMFGGASTVAQTPKPAAAPIQVIGGGGARPPSFKKPAYKPPVKPSGGGVVAPKIPSAIPRPSPPSGGVLAPKSPVAYPPKLTKTQQGDWGPWKTPPEISEGYGDVNAGNFPESGPYSSTVAESDGGGGGRKEALFNWWDIWGDVDPSTIHAPGGPTYGDPPAPGSAAYEASGGAAVVPTSASGGSFFGGGSSGYGFDDYDDGQPMQRAAAPATPPPSAPSGPSSTTLAIGAGVVALGVVAYLKGWI